MYVQQLIYGPNSSSILIKNIFSNIIKNLKLIKDKIK